MPKFETKFSKYFNLPNPGLRAYFDRVETGQPDEYRTPFYKGKSLQSLVKEWSEELLPLKTQWPSLYDFEIDLGKKVGPMSVMKPLKDRMDDIDHYYEDILLSSTPISAEAITAVKAEWRQAAGLRIRSEQRTVDTMKKSTNSGSPYFSKRNTVLKKTLPLSVVQVTDDTVIQSLNGGSSNWNGCAVLGWRGQEGGPNLADVKQRVIWMFPFAVNIKELQVYQPLIEALQRHDFVPAWVGMESVDAGITRLFDSKRKNDLVICTDFSRFDQHFNKSLQDVAKQLLEWLFTGDKSISAWIDDIYPIKYTIPLAYDWDKMRFGSHGMGSGSGGTNADETLAHRVLQHEAAILANAKLNPNSQCLGDDGVLSFPGCTVEDVMQAYSSHGLDMNQDKQYASTHDCVYLRRWHHEDYRQDGVCVGVYSTLRALGRLAEQERYYDPDKWGCKMVALRQLSILENVKYHPLNEKFVDFCMKGDKFRLGLDIPGFLDSLEQEAKKAIEYMPDFLGYTKSLQREGKNIDGTGIADWWIVKYLKSKR